MNLIVPYAVGHADPRRTLQAGTRAVGEKFCARFVLMTTDTSYWELFEELWAAEDDFVVVEQDVVPTDELIQSMWECREPWCSTELGQLGCVKFGSIRQQIPDLMARASKKVPSHSFELVDSGLTLVLVSELGLSPHLHHPSPIHMHPPMTDEQAARARGMQGPVWPEGSR